MKRLCTIMAAAILGGGSFLRAAFAWNLEDLSLASFLAALGYGVLADMQALGLAFGLLGAGFLFGRRWAPLWLAVVALVLVILLAAEIIFWTEFQLRPQRLVLHYITHVREWATFLQEQLHLTRYVLPVIALMVAVAWYGRRFLPVEFSNRHRRWFVAWLGVAGLVAAFSYSGPTSPSRPFNQLAGNGPVKLLRAIRIQPLTWNYWLPESDPRSALEAATAEPAASESGSGASARPATAIRPAGLAARGGFRHLLIVIAESFAGPNWQDPNLRRQYMPRMAELAGQGIYFDAIHATGSRTVRGLEAILNGFPPLPGVGLPGQGKDERLPSLPRALGDAGFMTSFVYGGWPGFTNFFDYWRRIGFQQMLSRDDFENPGFETSWGVADEILYDRVLVEMDKLSSRHDRVMLTTLTVTNHHPFDFPPGRIPYPSDERQQAYAMAYADWALGRFVDQAANRPWFEDTLLVVVADHGPIRPGRALLPANHFRVPMLFYQPARLKPAVIAHHGSTMSLAVTLLDLLDVASSEPLFGWNLLTGPSPAPVEDEYHVGWLGPERLTVLVRGGGLMGWRYRQGELLPAEPDPAQARAAEQLFRAAIRDYAGAP